VGWTLLRILRSYLFVLGKRPDDTLKNRGAFRVLSQSALHIASRRLLAPGVPESHR
jgi:hypothetical protein